MGTTDESLSILKAEKLDSTSLKEELQKQLEINFSVFFSNVKISELN